jgi:hypothetical protein
MNFFLSNYDASKLNIVFNESYTPTKKSSNIFTSSINTSQIDQYRQGIELTTQKYYDTGMVKIHAGEQGHILNPIYIGNDIDIIFRKDDMSFSELDSFNPVTYIQNQEFPTVINDGNLSLFYGLNGIVEPLTIRDCITFKNIELPYTIHSIKASMTNAAQDNFLASSEIVSCDYLIHDNNPAYIDSGDNNCSIDQSIILNENRSITQPFIDQKIPKNIPFSNTTQSDLGAALCQQLTTTSSYSTNDSYIRYNQSTAAMGFIYDNVQGVGTDSITFGGMTY